MALVHFLEPAIARTDAVAAAHVRGDSTGISSPASVMATPDGRVTVLELAFEPGDSGSKSHRVSARPPR